MSQLTKDQVRHIAKLARLRLSEAEVEKFSKELTSIINFVDMLGEVDTTNVEPSKQVTGLQNALRDDIVRTDGAPPDALLAASPLSISDHQIVSPSAHGN
jgi:aspartyl-tRNA(Asn)/glutamyl-tRNA(Gln) amidotransferase subunit C